MMELKNAVAVCLITLFSATVVVLIARSLDSQAAARLEPHLARIVDELEAIRSSGGIVSSSASRANDQSLRDGLIVYYFHSNIRCPTCQAIESQAHDTVEADFSEQMASGEIVWKTVNYEAPAASELATKFEIQMPVVVLAPKKGGLIGDWDRLDQVWGLVDDKAAFAEYIRAEISQKLNALHEVSTSEEPGDDLTIPVPDEEENEPPVSTVPAEIPVPE